MRSRFRLLTLAVAGVTAGGVALAPGVATAASPPPLPPGSSFVCLGGVPGQNGCPPASAPAPVQPPTTGSCPSPQVSSLPSSGLVGSKFLMKGSAWVPGGVVHISLPFGSKGLFGAESTNPTVGSGGGWQTGVTVSASPVGSYTFTLTESAPGCSTGELKKTLTFEVTSPAPAKPVRPKPNPRPTPRPSVSGHVRVVGIANCNSFTSGHVPWAVPASNVHLVAANGETHDVRPVSGLGLYAVAFSNVPRNGEKLTAHVTCFFKGGPGQWSRSTTLSRNFLGMQEFDLKYKW
jgi:hypothetical protein